MKTQPVIAASLQLNADGVAYSPRYDDVYHPLSGALAQARHVFIAGSGLPERWRGRERFVVLETGFGLGNNFLATWDAWRRDGRPCGQLHFISIEQHPLTRDDMRRVPRDAALAPLAQQLAQEWPPLTPNLHRLSFEGGRVQLLLALGDVAAWLPEIVAQVDAFYLDGFAPAKNPRTWEPRIFKAMARRAAPGATVATWTAAHAVRDGLASAGFQVSAAPGQGGKRDITLARYEPAFTPRRAPGRTGHAASATRHAVVIGAGLAGCASAWALAEQGWTSTVLDRHAQPAQEASGNAGGLFHGVVHPHDGTHARLHRAAAMEAQRAVQQAISARGALGSAGGLLRLETSGRDASSMREMLAQQGLPIDFVQALDAYEASILCDLPIAHPAWFYPGGGWVNPPALARAFVERAGGMATFRASTPVDSLCRADGRWQLLATDGALIEQADVVVLANAYDALRLLGHPPWPVQRVRGQVSMLPSHQLRLPRIPVAGSGYLLPEVDGLALFGATVQAGDDDPSVRDADHSANLEQLARLIGVSPEQRLEDVLGRTAWRCVTDDRLPIIGAVPDPSALASSGRPEKARFAPRIPGLFVFTALGSRGITWSALGAQVLASAVTGAPSPVESSLLDAVDPARFIARSARRTGR